MPSLPEIVRRTERLVLRRLGSDDEAEFVRAVVESADEWRPWSPAAPSNLTPADLFERELERSVTRAKTGTHLRLAAFDEAGRLVGLFSLNEIVRGVFHSAHAGWQVRSGWTGRGLGTEGVRALLDIAFDDPPDGLGLHRVQANIIPGNAASMRLAEKIGFRREGLAERYLRIAGEWQDHAMFALTAEEWPPEE